MYEVVSLAQHHPGQEHWLPLFHDKLDSVLDFVSSAPVSFDHLAEDSIRSRFEQIEEHYKARVEGLESQSFGAPPYKPVPPDMMFLDAGSWSKALANHPIARLTPFDVVDAPNVRHLRGKAEVVPFSAIAYARRTP